MHCRPSQRRIMMFRKRSSNGNRSSGSASLASEAVNGHGNGTAGRDHGSPALIQRLIIIHDGLMPLPPSKLQPGTQQRRNPQLSEDASLEEHGEFILYYYDHSLHFSKGRQPNNHSSTRSLRSDFSTRRASIDSDVSANSGSGEKPPADHATEEAVRFAGICRALRSLPLSLRQEKHDRSADFSDASEDELRETEVVHLKDSTLIYVPLELRGDIVAVAQIPRANKPHVSFNKSGHPQNQRLSVGFGADPSAMQGAIRHIHATFSLFFGGGIHRRLLQTKHVEGSKDWVFEVIVEKEGDEDDASSHRSGNSSSHRSHLKRKENAVWEVSAGPDCDPIEKLEKELETKKPSRRKARRSLKKLSSSISAGNSFNLSLNSSNNSADGNQMSILLIDSYFADYRYGGMEELFNLRREHRKLSNEVEERQQGSSGGRFGGRFGGLERTRGWESRSNPEDLFNDIANDVGHNDCERRIENLLKILPITHLREDLVNFYDEWLRRMQGVCEIMQGGVGRCVVEMVPQPVRLGGSAGLETDSVRGQHPPASPTAFVCLAAGEFMKSLMHEEVPKLKDFKGRLFGMSMFYKSRLVLTEVSSHGNKNEHDATEFPPEIPHMIAEYFHSSQKKAASGHTAAHEKDDQDANEDTITRWMSFGSMKDETVAADNNPLSMSDRSGEVATNGDVISGYIACPSSLKDSNPLVSLFVRKLNKHVWLPRIYLPSSPSFDGTDDSNKIETYAAFFEDKELSFILIFELPNSRGENNALASMTKDLKIKTKKGDNGSGSFAGNDYQAFSNALTFITGHITEFCNTYTSHEVDGPASNGMAPFKEINSNIVFPGEAGMDIICVNRDANSFVLLSQHDLSTNDFKRFVPKTNDSYSNDSKATFGLFGLGKPKESSEKNILRPALQYTNVLDCRHKLAACLPLDVMLAFDDMFNEFGSLSCWQNTLAATQGHTNAHANNDMCSDKSIEMCSFLPQGWVYGRAFGNVELYILLDTTKFVTINDVQKAVIRAREKLFNDRIR